MNDDILTYIRNNKTIIKDRIIKQDFYEDLKKMFEESEFESLIEYCYFLKVGSVGRCEYNDCGEKTKFISFKKGYKKGCCADHNTRINNIEKYGVENVMQDQKVKQTFKKTMIEKYGVANALQNTEVLEKMKNTQISEHGAIGAANENTKQKMKLTIQQKYGVDNVMKNIDIQSKRNETMMQKFGTVHALQNDDINQKRIDTNKKRFGATHHMKSQSFKKNMMVDFIENKIQKLSEYVIPEFDVKTYNGVEDDLRWRCVKCDSVFEDNIDNGKIPRCMVCNPLINVGYSKMEQGLVSELQKYCSVITNDRNILGKKEIDVVVNDKNVAIEFNGIFWHSELMGKDKNYHLEKTQHCENKGIRLIHIFDTEWIEKKDIVVSVVKSKLGLFNKRVYARKCIIREIDTHTKNKFLNDNHLQGDDKSSVKLGLFYDDELVGMMTFGKSRYNKKYQYEMHRFCNKIGYQVVGGASKLFSYFKFKYDPSSIITYADRRYSDGTFYQKIGFDKIGESAPNYFYFKGTSGLMSRIKFQKHKLKDKLDNFDPELTEWDNMQLNGYNRIWDCGNYIFEWKKFN